MVGDSDLTQGHAPAPSLPPASPLSVLGVAGRGCPARGKNPGLPVSGHSTWWSSEHPWLHFPRWWQPRALPQRWVWLPERPSSQGQLQADSTAGLGCHEGCGNDSNTMTQTQWPWVLWMVTCSGGRWQGVETSWYLRPLQPKPFYDSVTANQLKLLLLSNFSGIPAISGVTNLTNCITSTPGERLPLSQ